MGEGSSEGVRGALEVGVESCAAMVVAYGSSVLCLFGIRVVRVGRVAPRCGES
jgi:hypothetical protein